MKEITQTDHLGAELNGWRGARAKLWNYHVTLQHLTIRLDREDGKSNLHILCSPCIRINAPVVWQVYDIRIEEIYHEDIQRVVYYLIDQEAGVEIRCARVSARRDVPPFFNQ